MEILRTPRLILRTWTLTDVADGFAIWGDPEVMKYVDSGNAQSLDSVTKSIEAGIKHQEKFGYQHWAVIENESEKLIGACGFNRTEVPGQIELVFHFAKVFWGKGYATESAKACVAYAAETLKPIKIIAGCHPENEPSKKILLKTGFTFIGNKWFEDTQREEPCYEMVR